MMNMNSCLLLYPAFFCTVSITMSNSLYDKLCSQDNLEIIHNRFSLYFFIIIYTIIWCFKFYYNFGFVIILFKSLSFCPMCKNYQMPFKISCNIVYIYICFVCVIDDILLIIWEILSSYLMCFNQQNYVLLTLVKFNIEVK